LERYGSAPRTKWNDVEQRFDVITHRRFMPDLFTHHHTKIIVPPSIVARRVGVVSMHDLDSGERGIHRYFNQLQSVLKYDDPAKRSEVMDRWAQAASGTNHDRYKVMYDMEEEALIPALAKKLGISEDTTRVVFNKINEERKRTFEGLSSGKGRMYDTAPSFAQRLQDEVNPTARVTSPLDKAGAPVADANGMVTIEFRDGQKLVTAEVPEGMLAPRVNPVDVTQTPNYYQPADVRRLYYEMKRHQDTLAEIDAMRPQNALTGIKEFAAHDAANLAEIHEIVGRKFYALWKPLQLWRLGWPQRVLMDEGLRALAVFGPMYWTSGPGAEAFRTVARNTPAFLRDKYRAGARGKVVLSDGPLAPKSKAPNAFAFQNEVAHTTRIPANEFPKVNAERLARMESLNVAAGKAVRTRDKFRALEREAGREAPRVPDEAIDSHPILRALTDANDPTRAYEGGVRVYDPVSGKAVSKGYFVPLPEHTYQLSGDWPIKDNNLLRWYEQNSELLARRGIRVRVDGDKIEIGRWFNSKERGRAHGAVTQVARSKPLGEQTHHGFDLGDGSKFELRSLDTPDPSTMFDFEAAAARADSNLADVAEREPLSVADAFAQFDAKIDMPLPHKDFGAGRSHFYAHGKDYYYNDVFEGHLGRLTKALTSSAPAIDNLTDAHTAALGLMRYQAGGHVRIHAPKMTPEALQLGTEAHRKAVLYFQRWADLMNNQVGNSPVWGPMLRGASDEDIVKYLKTDPKGYKHLTEILDPSASVEMYVNEMRAKLNYYLPSHELQRRLGKGPINASDLRRKVHNDDLPDIYGPELTLEDKHFLRRVADNIWNGLGTIPADKFSRQPFAKAIYNQKVRSLINQSDAKFLNESALERIHSIAANHTREQIRQHLFDLTDGTNLTEALRFIAPFWGAQEEAILKWGKIISDRPETIARFFAGERAVYNNVMVVDENNQPVPLSRAGNSIFDIGLNYHPNDKVIFPVPGVLRHGWLGDALKNIGSIGIPVGSANTVLQGDMPIMPALGPWVTMPVDKLMNAWSDTHGTEYANNVMYRWLFPIGRPDSGYKGILEQMLPGWGRRVMGATGSEDDATHANLYMMMAREMTLRNKRLGLPDPTPDQVEAAANLLWGARTVASMVSPVQLEFRPIHQFWADEAHRYKREYGADWETKFFNDYKEEAMIYAVSSSNSLAGVPPTSEGMQRWSQNKELVAKYPDLGGLIVGSDAYLGAFNQDAYRAQFNINLGPGDSRTLREITDPRAREAQAEESIGWIKFRKIDATVQAELYARGLTNIQQSGAEDIARYRTDQIQQLMREYPAWATAWNTSDRTIYQKVEAMKEIAANPQFDNRLDIQGLRDYLTIREQVTHELDQAYAQGYASRNLQAQENYALRNWFYNAVGQIIQKNPAFGELYSRYLNQDTLEQGSGGYGG
jgi:hypothetical protein